MPGFATAEVEDGTGLSTALVYEQNAAVVSYLNLRLAASTFSAASDAEQKRALLNATEVAEREMRRRVRCFPVTEGQRLIFPAMGAYNSSGRLMDDDSWATFMAGPYVEGIRLLAEAAASGKLLQFAGGPPVSSESSSRGSVSYRGGVDLNSIAASHPDAWSLISRMIPRM
jgi:hypothetical protein